MTKPLFKGLRTFYSITLVTYDYLRCQRYFNSHNELKQITILRKLLMDTVTAWEKHHNLEPLPYDAEMLDVTYPSTKNVKVTTSVPGETYVKLQIAARIDSIPVPEQLRLLIEQYVNDKIEQDPQLFNEILGE